MNRTLIQWTDYDALRGASYDRNVYPRLTGQPKLDWIIVGGESGRFARPFNFEWARSVRRACEASGTAFFVKQLGSLWAKEHHAKDSHGGDPSEWPEDLRVRQWPRGLQRMAA